MPSGAQEVEVVVSGGGIGGAVLAEILARRGQRVLVLERNLAPPAFLRPEVLWPGSIDVLCGLHPRALWEAEATLLARGVRAVIGTRAVGGFDQRMLDELDVHPWFANPNDARELLLRRASFELRRGIEVVSVLRDGARVAGVRARDRSNGAEFEVTARWTIGDDGEHSAVRRGCSIEIDLTPFPFEFLSFNFDWPATLEPAVARAWIHPSPNQYGIVALAAMPFVGGRSAGLVPIRPAVFDALQPIDEAWKSFLALDPEMRAVVGERALPQDFTRISRRFGHAATYGCPGAFILGDAAHPVSPVGGQGANMSIADARVLARAMLETPDAALERYEQQRRPANERSLRFSRMATRVVGLPRGLISNVFWGIARHVASRRFATKRALRIASRSFLESAN